MPLPNRNNIEAPNGGNSDELKKNLNDDVLLILEGKGSQYMVGATKEDVDRSLSIEKFDSYDQESTKSCLQKVSFDCDDVRALLPSWEKCSKRMERNVKTCTPRSSIGRRTWKCMPSLGFPSKAILSL